MITPALKFGSLALVGLGLLLQPGCAGQQPAPPRDEPRVVDELFEVRFFARPSVRDLGYVRVWQACRERVSLRVTCSAFYDHQLGDEMLAAHIGWPPGVPFVFTDRRDDRDFALARRVRYAYEHRIHDLLLVEAHDTLFVVYAEGPADEASKIIAREFVESFRPILGAQCPTVKVLRLDGDRHMELEPTEDAWRGCPQ